MLGVAAAFEQAWLADTLRVLIGISAFAILFIACNAAMLGLSRLGYSLALNRQIPSAIGRLHPTRATPVVIIVVGALLAILLLIPADIEFLAAIYAFGATIAFTIVHLSVIRLRWREPDRDRPFKIPVNVRVGQGRAAGAGGARGGAVVRRVRRGDRPPRRRALGGRRLDGVRDRALRRLPPRRGQADLQARDGPRARADAAGHDQGRVRLDPRARARAPARRRHHADRRPPGRGGERGRGRGRRGDRGAVGVRGADGAAARRADPRRGAQARAQGARSAPRRWGRSTRASRSPPRPCARAAPARRSCARRSAAASRRSCSPPRSRRGCAAGRCWAASAGSATRSWARRRATW